MGLFKKKIADNAEDKIVNILMNHNGLFNSKHAFAYEGTENARTHQGYGMAGFVTGAMGMAASMGLLAKPAAVAFLTVGSVGLTTMGAAMATGGAVAIAGLAYMGIAKIVEKVKYDNLTRDPLMQDKIETSLHRKLLSAICKSDDFSLTDINSIRALAKISGNRKELEDRVEKYKKPKNNI